MTAARYTPRPVADLTAHPDIFGPTYWGGFDMDGNADVITGEIIENRDRLVADYHVEKLAGIRVDVPSTPAGQPRAASARSVGPGCSTP
ncbi:MAG: hypothetical protein BWY57_03545 [Betaproteobacteria bacterium ADurb.Bin341]|nr:MAG: hypothetical protein BWY57_03545 [Betaproteobacteria bacterium ADurb.Bin341]